MEISSAQSKRDFGSFQSSNVEELIRLDSSVYQKPVWDVEFTKSPEYACLVQDDLKDKLGTATLRERLFYLKQDEFVFLNHGAFGMVMKPTLRYVHEWNEFAEAQPLRFNDRLIIPLMVDVIRLFAEKVLFCKPCELGLVDNCTFAFNSIVQSMRLDEKHHVLIFSTTYGAYKKLLASKCQLTKSKLVEMEIKFPIDSEEELFKKTVQKFDETYLKPSKENSLIKYFFVDLIPSNLPFLMPVKQLVDLCKSKRPDIVCVVDAAHGLGSVPNFNFKSDQVLTTNIDLLITNCHKWFCGPKGTALIYRNERLDRNPLVQLHPAVQSHGINSGFNSEFSWTGLKNYASFLGLYSTYQIWTECLGGFEHVIGYCTSLARNAAQLLQTMWSTRCLVSPDLCSTMVNVQLPERFIRSVLIQNLSSNLDSDSASTIEAIRKLQDLNQRISLKYAEAEVIQNFLYNNYKVEVPIKALNDMLYVRISAHIYNNLDEYSYLATVVLDNQI